MPASRRLRIAHRQSSLHPDQVEFVETELWTRDQVRQAIQSGDICDAKTLLALQHWLMESA